MQTDLSLSLSVVRELSKVTTGCWVKLPITGLFRTSSPAACSGRSSVSPVYMSASGRKRDREVVVVNRPADNLARQPPSL